jgi:acetolactate decarboxylase
MTNTVTQVSILNALLSRRFDGLLSCRELSEHGDLGIGTFDRMDGELIMVDGAIHHGKPGGAVHPADPATTVPFATVCRFRPEESWALDGPMDYAALDRAIDTRAANRNVVCAIRVDGHFAAVRTHALQKQQKPYPPTAEVVKGCVHTDFADLEGTIVGFRGVPYLRGLNDTSYHLHFVSRDRSRGGHVLDFALTSGRCAIGRCTRHVVILPEHGDFLDGIDMSTDLVAAFEDALAARA